MPNPIRQVGTVVSFTPTLDTVQYADGDILADTAELASVVTRAAGCCTLTSVHVLDEDDQGVAFDILFLNASQTLGTINNAPGISDANARKIIGRMLVPAASFYDIGGSKFASITANTSTGNLPLMLKAGESTTSLYVALISRGTGTYTASGLKLQFGFEMN